MKDSLDINAIIDILKAFRTEDRKRVGLHEPFFGGNEWVYIKECLDTGWVSSVGKYVDVFEQMLQEFTGVKRAVAVVNGTAALHVALRLVGVQPGDEVLVPDLTFIATASVVTYCGALPHFVDCEEQTLGIDPNKLEKYLRETSKIRDSNCINSRTGRRIKAVIAMHTFGHPVDLDGLSEVADRFNIELVEDAAEALGSYYRGRHVGNWGKTSILSFNGNKTITTGGGGAILTNDARLGALAKHLTTTAKIPHSWEFTHDQIGYNYRLPNINAALGCAQMEQLSDFLKRKRRLAMQYKKAFSEISGITFFNEPEFAKSNYWLNVLMLKKTQIDKMQSILETSHANGVACRPAWTLMHKLPMFNDFPRMDDVSAAEDLEARIINIPSSVFLSGNSMNG